MNQNNDMPQLGYFLDYDRHWLQALRLLKYQLKTKIKKKNRHFNTLEMFYYEKFEESFRTCFKKQEIVPKCCGFGNPLRAALGGSR